jgi:imidazolonepropionase
VTLLANIGVLAACRMDGGQGAIHALRQAALVWEGDRIVWIGAEAGLPREYRDSPTRIDAVGQLVVPGLIDCHTHLAFGGWRADEFEQRLLGRTYREIAAAGGGIARTTAATRAASDQELIDRCRGWLAEMAALGVTTVEAKSGYGLSVEQELRMLAIYQELQRQQPVRIVATLLAAHVVPPEYRDRRSEYVALVCDALIPEAARRGLARFCDVFVEASAFTPDEARTIAHAARAHGLGVKLHVDQLSDGGGAALAAELGAVSADHLEYASEAGIRALAGAQGTVAVSVPLASLYLDRQPFPARRAIAAGVPVAVATDFNPGTAPSFHLPLALLLACTRQHMTPAEALKAATIYAAKAIGEEREAGSLEPGKRADFAIIDAPDVNHWIYQFAANRCIATFIGGRRVY